MDKVGFEYVDLFLWTNLRPSFVVFYLETHTASFQKHGIWQLWHSSLGVCDIENRLEEASSL
jgi:hypothetical protein